MITETFFFSSNIVILFFFYIEKSRTVLIRLYSSLEKKMSATDNWIKLYRWWQEHLKSHLNLTPSIRIENHPEQRNSSLYRRSSLMSFHSSNKSRRISVKKRASFGGVEQNEVNENGLTNGAFRYVRDSIRNKHSRSTTTNLSNHKRFVEWIITISFSILTRRRNEKICHERISLWLAIENVFLLFFVHQTYRILSSLIKPDIFWVSSKYENKKPSNHKSS